MREIRCLGRRIIAELYDRDEKILDDTSYIRDALINAAIKANVQVIDYRFHRFTHKGRLESS